MLQYLGRLFRFQKQRSNLFPKNCIPNTKFKNEPILSYLHGSKEKKELEKVLQEMSSTVTEVPIVINGEEITSNEIRYQIAPFDHNLKVAKFFHADKGMIRKCIETATKAQVQWDKIKMEERVMIFEKVADLLSGKYRHKINAATILGQGKTILQAELDAACELIDFLRINCTFLADILKYEPLSPDPDLSENFYRLRGCEGFWAAISPFNSTAIAGNLASSPILMGNAVIWKPSDSAVLSNWIVFQAFREAGLPPGVLNFLPGGGVTFGDTITSSRDLAGINFTGSANTFSKLWSQVGSNIEKYSNIPRVLGELGGKNYHFVHSSADVASVVNGTIRAAFEYAGQKCSACSIMYIPKSLSDPIRESLIKSTNELSICHPTHFNAFTSAVIDRNAYNRIVDYIEYAKKTDSLQILAGGFYTDEIGYYVEPTIILSKDQNDKMMKEEIFGPILIIYVYNDENAEKVMEKIANCAVYALTGSIYTSNHDFLMKALDALKMTAGNLYINDKSTGAIVGQQPFGGRRRSGTNDKSGGPHYLLRFANPQSIKQNFVGLNHYSYPHMKSVYPTKS